jgi:alcohol sulfotransferase
MEPDEARIDEAVRFASVDNLRELERGSFFRSSGIRMMPKDRGNPDSYKVRRAKVGGYRDYFDDDQLAEIDALVQSTLSPVFGYQHEPLDGAPAAVAQHHVPAQEPTNDRVTP